MFVKKNKNLWYEIQANAYLLSDNKKRRRTQKHILYGITKNRPCRAAKAVLICIIS